MGCRLLEHLKKFRGGAGEDVLDSKCRVLNKNGEDVTSQFVRGAEETLRIANQLKVKEFIGKFGSPSCGCGRIYDGSFSGRLVSGDGVTIALLKKNGIRIISEEDL